MIAPCLFLQRLGVDSLTTTPRTRPTMREITALVAERYGLTPEALRSPSRSRDIAWPRQEAMALIRKQGRYSYPQIGRHFDRDHTTVIHACRAYAKRVAEAERWAA